MTNERKGTGEKADKPGRGSEQEHAERGVPHPPPEGDSKGSPSDDRLQSEVSHGREDVSRPG